MRVVQQRGVGHVRVSRRAAFVANRRALPTMSLALLTLVTLASFPDVPKADAAAVTQCYTAEVTFDGALAHLTYELTLASRKRGALEFDETLALPEGGVAGELAVLRDGRWEAGELLDEKAANQRYERALVRGRAAPVPAAVMSHTPEGHVRLRVYPLLRNSPVRLRYQVLAPLSAERGAWLLDATDATLRGCGAGRVRASATFEVPLRLTTHQEGVRLSSEVPRATMDLPDSAGVWASAADAVLPPDGRVSRVQIAMARRLSEAPRGTSVVFVLDASRSEGDEGVKGQLRALRRYLELVPDAAVEVVVFRRTAECLFGAFVPATEVSRRLAELPVEALATGNGSELGLALERAAEVLRGRNGPARVVVLTDGLTPTRFMPERLSVTWPEGTVLNVGLMRVSWTWPHTRWAYLTGLKPGHPLSPLAERTGGIVLALNPEDELLEELVRPTQLISPRLLTGGAPLVGQRLPELLAEGEEVVDWQPRLTALPPLELEGRLWSRTVRWPVPRDERVAAALPALAVNSPLASQVTDVQRAYAAKSVGVVGPGSAVLVAPRAATGMAVPSQAPGSGVMTGRAVGGCISDGVMDPPDRDTPEAASWLAELLALAARRCGVAGSAAVEVETTFHEVVDVHATGPAAACLEAAAWGLTLDRRFTQQQGRFRVNLSVQP